MIKRLIASVKWWLMLPVALILLAIVCNFEEKNDEAQSIRARLENKGIE